MEELVLGPLGQAEDLFKLDADTETMSAGFTRSATCSAHHFLTVISHVSCGLLIAQHVGVRGHDRGSGLLWDTGGLRGGFALVHQLLHGVRDALVAGQSDRHPESKRVQKHVCVRER